MNLKQLGKSSFAQYGEHLDGISISNFHALKCKSRQNGKLNYVIPAVVSRYYTQLEGGVILLMRLCFACFSIWQLFHKRVDTFFSPSRNAAAAQS